MLNWAQRFGTFCFLDNHQYQLKPHLVECLLAAGVKRSIKASAANALDQLQQFIDEKSAWLFGHLGYDLKNETEKLSSSHPDKIDFPDLFFFEPEFIIRLNGTEIVIEGENAKAVYEELISAPIISETPKGQHVIIQKRFSEEEYVSVIKHLQQHILRGDCYEINFCQEFFSEDAPIDPLNFYKKLGDISPNPFSALYRLREKWLICASPERFLQKKGNKLLSQPIKGTSKRMPGNSTSDGKSREELLYSAKNRSENVMVVDLVRNDLAKVCKEGTVKVDELFGVYTFPQVFQMISTISGQVKENMQFTDIIRATFPMGSMTGAPKKRVMELIEEYEKTKRGIFSGAVGYISPENDFDFNVVIRSVMYNAARKYFSYQVGSGITFYSKPEEEWEECLLKAEAINKVLENE